MHARNLVFALFALVLLGALPACQKKALRSPLPEKDSLAVAAFSNPRYNWQTLAGCLPEQCGLVAPDTLKKLNAMLVDKLAATDRRFASMAAVRQCQEVVTFEHEKVSPRAAALSYWLKVGACVPADYLLVPQVMYYRERVGGDWGVETPASVNMHFYLLDVKNRGVAGRYVYDETQEPLSANLLNTGTFLKRGARWVTAEELAKEAVQTAIEELGL